MKLAIIILLLAGLALPAGCATHNFPEYARAKTEVAQAEAQTNQQVPATLGRSLQSPNPNTQTAAAMGLAFWLAGRRPTKLEQARSGPIEQGIGKALPSLPMWGAVYGMFSQAAATPISARKYPAAARAA
jgi:hypothetical protein